MATKTLVSLEEYLHTTWEHDREYVRGEVIERGMPTKSHNKTGLQLIRLLEPQRQSLGWFAIFETRSRVEEEIVRIPDVAVWEREPPEEVPPEPPLIALEVLSPDDRMGRLLGKLAEYKRWGVRHVWVADPEEKKFWVFDDALREASKFEIPEHGMTIMPADLFD